MSFLTDYLNLNNVEYIESANLSRYSTIKIGGYATVIFPKTTNELIKVVNFLFENELKCKVIGGLSNILLPDGNIETVFIKTDRLKGIKKQNKQFTFYAGERLAQHAQSLAKDGYGGFLGLAGIPGSIGGMLRSNAGAFGDEMKDVVKSALVYFPALKKITAVKSEEMLLSYRNSIFKDSDCIILSVDLEFDYTDSAKAMQILYENRQKRKNTQPSLPSLGSVFKRPQGLFAAKLIDDSGLKGTTIGGAEISEKHGGFIVNKNNASSDDVKKLIKLAKETVYHNFKINLEEEIEIL